jgi:hypothetical protein
MRVAEESKFITSFVSILMKDIAALLNRVEKLKNI